MKYLKLHIYLIGLLFSISGFSQIRAIEFEIIVDQPYPRTIEEFLTIQDKLLINVFNNTDSEQEFVMQLEIYQNGDLWAYTKPDFNGLMMMLDEFGSETIDATNSESYGFSLNENDITFSDPNDRNYLAFNRALPDGIYSICISAFDADVTAGQAPIRISEGYPISCGEPFQILFTQAPLLLNNVNEECIDVEEDESLFFDWWMISGTDENAMIEYDFKVIEYTPGGTAPEQLFADGIAVIHEESNTVFPGDFTHEFNPVETSSGMQMVPGNFYAWQIRINSIGGLLQSGDQSYSPVGIFKYRYCDMNDIFDDLEDIDTDNLDDCNCTVLSEETQNTETINSEITSFRAGSFGVVTSGAITPIDGRYSGEGLIRVGLLNNVLVKVAFENIKINAEGYMMPPDASEEGGVFYTLNDDTEAVSEQLSSFIDNTVAGVGNSTGIPIPGGNGDLLIGQIDPDKVADFDQLMRNVDVVNDIISGNERGMPLAIQQEFNGMDIMLGITAIKFSVDPFLGHKAEYHLMVNIPINIEDDIKYISFGAWVCGGPSGFAPDAVLHMVNNLVIGDEEDDENFVFTFEGGGTELANLDQDVSTEKTFLSFNCNGITGGKMVGTVQLPRESFTLEDGNGGKTEQAVVLDFNGEFSVAENVSQEEGTGESEGENEENNIGFLFEISGGDNYFQYTGLEGWGLKINNASLDFSETINPNSFSFPEGYDKTSYSSDETINLWTGLFIEKLAISPPTTFYQNARSNAGIEVTNLMIEPEFSGIIETTQEILSINEGDIDGFGFSIENINIKVIENEFKSGQMAGNITVPFFEDQDDGLVYSSIISRNASENKYTFLIEPETDGQKIPMWDVATFTMSESSHIKMNKSTDEDFKLNAALVGSLNLDLKQAEKIGLPGVGVNLVYDSEKGFNTNLSNFAFNMSDMWDQFNENIALPEYGYSDINEESNTVPPPPNNNTDVIIGEMGKFQGFDISLNQLELVFGADMSSGGFNFHPALKIDADINLGFGGQNDSEENTQFGAGAGITIKTKGSGAPNYTFEYDGIELNRMRLKGNMPGTTVDGELKINRGGNPSGEVGDGFEAVVAAKFPSGFAAYVGGAFGKNDNYNYWYLEAQAKFPEPGIIMGPVAMASAGLGIYYNMDMNMGIPSDDKALGKKAMEMAANDTEVESDIDPESLENKSSQIDLDSLPNITTVLSGLRGGSSNKPIPSEDVRGFSLLTSLSMPGGSSAIHLDVGISGQFSSNNNSPQIFNIRGKAFAMTPVDHSSKYNGPKFAMGVALTWKIHDDGTEFTGDLDADLNLKNGSIGISGAGTGGKLGNAKFYIDTRPSSKKWYFYAGNPYNKKINDYEKQFLGIKVDIPPLGGSRYDGYFMIGDGLPKELPPLPSTITKLFKSFNSGNNDNSLEGPNIATSASRSIDGIRGIAFGMKVHHDFIFDAWIARAKVDVVAGMDFNLSENRDNEGNVPTCNGQPIGVNGWYAQGQIFAGIDGNIQARNPFKNDAWWNLVSIQAAVKLAGGGPNPSWFKGAVGLRVSAFGGLVSGETSFDMKLGDECLVNQTPFGGMNFIQSISPSGRNIDVYETATLKLNYPVDIEYTFVEYAKGSGREIPVTYIPYVHRFKVSQTSGDTPWRNYNSRNKIDNTKFTVKLKDLPLKSNFEVYAEIRSDYIRGNSGELEQYKTPQDAIWRQDKTQAFRTIFEINDFQKYITSTYPFHTRNFHFVDDSKLVRITMGANRVEDLNEKFPYVDETFSIGGKEYIKTKMLVAKIYRNQKLVYDNKVYPHNNKVMSVNWGEMKSGLNNYNVDIVYRSKITINEESNYESDLSNTITQSNNTSMFDEVTQSNIANELNINLNLNTSTSSNITEQKVLNLVFGTSQFNSLEDKIKSLTTNKYGSFNVVKCEALEYFDKIDLGLVTRPNDPKIRSDVWESNGRISIAYAEDNHRYFTNMKTMIKKYQDFTSDFKKNSSETFDIYQIPTGNENYIHYLANTNMSFLPTGYSFNSKGNNIKLKNTSYTFGYKNIDIEKKNIFKNTSVIPNTNWNGYLTLFHSPGQVIIDPIDISDPFENLARRYFFWMDSQPTTLRFKHPAEKSVSNYKKLQNNYKNFVNSIVFDSEFPMPFLLKIKKYKYRRPINMYSRKNHSIIHTNCTNLDYSEKLYTVPVNILLFNPGNTGTASNYSEFTLQPISN